MESTKKDESLLRIARFLMLHGSFVNNLGLINGKMGIIIFFFHLSRYTENKIFEDFAGEMIDEIYKEIHNHYPTNFENGLSGIAWGIEYLIQNEFVKANSNEVLEDLDKMIFEWDVRKVSDFSLETGLEGITHYVISRCIGKPPENIIIPKDYISDLVIVLEGNKKAHNIQEISILKNILKEELINIDDPLLINLISKIKFQPAKIFVETRPLSIGNNGYAGIGLNLIFNNQ
ncbi:MAG: hypothetical protein LBT43_17460 [Prevotella sp.]|jgi:hypothetical protein|nr:hypothetical protein [Prevotella sp.]